MIGHVPWPFAAIRAAAVSLLVTLLGLSPIAAQRTDDAAPVAEAEPRAASDDDPNSDESDEPATHVHDEIVVTGTRARQRSITESMAPIDVISSEHVAHQGETNLDVLLRNVVPSLNISATSGDAAVVVRPTNLRGLAPDHTLVLVNGRRRHRGAVILWSRIGVSHGAQGPDLSAIPAIALRQVEVLRDGASAQYGSDAIAGVMNFLLKDKRSGGSFELLTGAYGRGDGESMTFAGNIGLPWGENGFLNLSLEYGGAEPTNSWTMGAALRFEDYDDFGSTVNGRLAARRQVAPGLALRGSVSTGFRAPTPGQQNAFNVSTQWDPNLLELVNNGTIPSTSRVAALRGGEALDAEKSLNLAAGMVLERGSLLLTADVFRIDLRDRLGVTQLFALERDEVDQLLAEGITSAANLAIFRFFANDFETRTEGVDLVASWQPEAWGGHTTLDFAINVTRTEVVDFNPLTLDARRIRELRDALPGRRWNASLHHEIGRFELLGRLGYFDGWWDPRDAWAYGGSYLLDLEAAVRIDDRTRFVIGGRNALDEAADLNPNPTVIGNLYSTRAPFDTNGGFYYARLQYRWGGGK